MSNKEAVHCNMENLQFRVVSLVDTVQKFLALALLLCVMRQQSTWASHTAGCTEPPWCQPAGTEIQKRGYLTENVHYVIEMNMQALYCSLILIPMPACIKNNSKPKVRGSILQEHLVRIQKSEWEMYNKQCTANTSSLMSASCSLMGTYCSL